MNRHIKILCTLGPSTIDPRIITKLDHFAVDMFRINLSHTDEAKIEDTIVTIAQSTGTPLCLDLEGAQIRSGTMAGNNVYFDEGSVVTIHREKIQGDAHNIQLTPAYCLDAISPGDLVSIDFDTLLLQVTSRRGEYLMAKVVCSGLVGSNKAVTVDKHIDLAPLSSKDLAAIPIALKHGVPYIALSFASHQSDVEALRELVGDRMRIISKIESKAGLRHLDGIIAASDAILLDRGDMSRHTAIEMIPSLQKALIARVNKAHIPVYVATNLLESMVDNKLPTRAEVNDVINTLLDGADGLVLAAETAIGDHPVECVKMVRRSIKSFELLKEHDTLDVIMQHDGNELILVEAHGGRLVNRMSRERVGAERNAYKKLQVDERFLCDAEQIAIGSYSPLEGFMNRDEIKSVLERFQMPGGTVWPLPIVLPVSDDEATRLKVGERVALVNKRDDKVYAVLDVEDIYPYDFADVARQWYGTCDSAHPGVDWLRKSGTVFLGGRIELIQRLRTPHDSVALTPRQTRHIFEKKGWDSIVGFHTRNVIHRAHEYIQLAALERYDIDGLFVHPVVGTKKRHDFSAEIVLKGYSLMMDNHYPKNRVVLGAFLSFSRYAGPREAVFTALVRKNFGCTHFIVGRDHTGVGGFYKPYAARELFDQLGDIGITPIHFNEVYYCETQEAYTEAEPMEEKDMGRLRISGSEVRQMFLEQQTPPEWFMRKDISELIREEMSQGREVFVR